MTNKNRQSGTIVIMAIIIIVAIVLIILLSGNKKSTNQDGQIIENTTNVEETTNTDLEENNSAVQDTEIPVSEDENSVSETDSSEVSTSNSGSYEAYSEDKISFASEGKVILFFHAKWCPTCRGLDQDIASNESTIPDDVLILKTDYDEQTTLKQKYGVTYQHTLVQVDQNGNLIKKWSGSRSLEKLLGNIQ